jgi:hypothetical protein
VGEVVVPEPAGISDADALAAGLRALRRRSGFSYAQLSQAAARLPRNPSRAATLPKSTVSDVLRTGRVGKPVLLAFLAACGVSDADAAHWVAAWERSRTDDLGRPDGAQRVRDADAQLLGVHKAIEVEGVQSSLPVYVPRDLDTGAGGIRNQLQEAARRGGIVVLVGGSSVGKSRSAFEAVRHLFPDWWLVHPDPDDRLWPEKLSAARSAPTVVWLDELQRYFEGAYPLTSDQIRVLLRSDTRIVIIGTLWPERYALFSAPPGDPLGPDLWRRQREVLELAQVVRVPDSLSDNENERARQLASMDPRLSAALQYSEYGLTQSIAAAPHLMERWRNANAYAMAVLNAAVDARRIGVNAALPAEFLRATAPAYCDSRARAKAPPDWFESAMDYCTHVLHGAATVLEPVAGGMGEVRGYTVAEYVHQHAANERRYIPVPGPLWVALEYIGDANDLLNCGYSAECRLLYDFALLLYQRAALSGNSNAAVNLASLLAKQGQIEAASSILQLLSDSGHEYAHHLLINLVVKAHRMSELQKRAESGDELAAVRLAGALAKSDRWEDGTALLRGYPAQSKLVRGTLADLLADHGEIDEAIQIRQGFPDDDGKLPYLLLQAGREQEFLDLAGSGDPFAAQRLDEVLADKGQVDVLLGRATEGDSYAALQAALALLKQDREEEALELLGQLGEKPEISGSDEPLSKFDIVRASQHNMTIAIARFYREEHIKHRSLLWRIEKKIAIITYQKVLRLCSIHSRLRSATRELVSMMEDYIADGGDEARDTPLVDAFADICREYGVGWDELYAYISDALMMPGKTGRELQEKEEFENVLSRLRLIDRLLDSGSFEEVRELAVTGDDLAAQELIMFLEENGRLDEAHGIIRERIEHGSKVAGLQLVDWLARKGRIEEIRELAAAGDTYAGRRLADPQVDSETCVAAEYQMLDLESKEVDDKESTASREQELRKRVAQGDTLAATQLTSLLQNASRIEELFTLTIAGLPTAARDLIEAMRAQGRNEDADRLQKFGVDLEGDIAPLPQHGDEGPSILITHFE